MPAQNDNLDSPKLQVTRERYKACYSAVRRNVMMQRSPYPEWEYIEHAAHNRAKFGKELWRVCFDHWFAAETARETGIGLWHGWHDAHRLYQWRTQYAAWFDVIFPIPF